MNNTTYLVTPKSIINNFLIEADKAYFSNPIKVEMLYSELFTKLLFVYDPNRGHTYPTQSRWVVPHWALSNQQKATVA